MTLYNSGLGGGTPIQPIPDRSQLLDCIHGKNPKDCNWCQQINKHSCTAEIIAELERLPDNIKGVMVPGVATIQNEMDTVSIQDLRLIIDELNRTRRLKAKETQL